jgi:hypothetical protein
MFNVEVVGDDAVFRTQFTRLILNSGGRICKTGAARIAVLCGGSFSGSLPSGCTAVTESDNRAALEWLHGSGADVITCGSAPTDTLSLSAHSDGAVSVSLMRSIITTDGERVEPLEITASFDEGKQLYAVMAACAVRLLSGENPSGGYKF